MGYLGDRHGLGAARDARHQSEITAVAPHDLEQERAMMRGRGHLEAVESLERDVAPVVP